MRKPGIQVLNTTTIAQVRQYRMIWIRFQDPGTTAHNGLRESFEELVAVVLDENCTSQKLRMCPPESRNTKLQIF